MSQTWVRPCPQWHSLCPKESRASRKATSWGYKLISPRGLHGYNQPRRHIHGDVLSFLRLRALRPVIQSKDIVHPVTQHLPFHQLPWNFHSQLCTVQQRTVLRPIPSDENRDPFGL